ncbi:acyl-CoA-binding domain-containing protein 6-like isoform X2 [Nymphaea colorata]|nr:acyl-CoA-binding domain-containing protein 6-like isoform X2 [Nymphaea colorata]
MAWSTAGLAYPERFYAAASYVGLSGGGSPSKSSAISRFTDDVALLLYGLYQQATVGPCTIPKPKGMNHVESSKWTSWNGLGNMAQTEAMRLFVKILEEEEPAWYSRVTEFVVDSVVDVETSNPTEKPVISDRNSFPEPRTKTAGGGVLETQDEDVVLEGFEPVDVHNKWIALSVYGPHPKARYEHGAATIQDKMYIVGGNHNGRYLNDLQVLDMKTLTWSKLEPKMELGSQDSPSPVPLAPCAGHSLIPWRNKLLSVAGKGKGSSGSVTVKAFDFQTCTWSFLVTYGTPPVSRGGQSVTVVGSSLVVFGGEDQKRPFLNDLYILDLETMTWDEIDTVGLPPSPRSDHTAAVHADRYLLIFGGASHTTCFNDLHVLDLESMVWSTPTVQGTIPTPRAGHAGVTAGENWFIVGGGDNKNGITETVVLNMNTFTWSVLTTVDRHSPLASEGLSLVSCSLNGDDVLIAFGGYNGRYSNEVHVLKPRQKSSLSSEMDAPAKDSITPLPTTDAMRTKAGKIQGIVMNNPENDGIDENGEQLIISTLKAEKESLEAALSKEQLLTLRLQQEVAEAETQNSELSQELQSFRSQLATEQSRCFKLEVDVAEIRSKLQKMETLEREVELLRRQKVASEEVAAMGAKERQGSTGLWEWIAGTPAGQ